MSVELVVEMVKLPDHTCTGIDAKLGLLLTNHRQHVVDTSASGTQHSLQYMPRIARQGSPFRKVEKAILESAFLAPEQNITMFVTHRCRCPRVVQS